MDIEQQLNNPDPLALLEAITYTRQVEGSEEPEQAIDLSQLSVSEIVGLVDYIDRSQDESWQSGDRELQDRLHGHDKRLTDAICDLLEQEPEKARVVYKTLTQTAKSEGQCSRAIELIRFATLKDHDFGVGIWKVMASSSEYNARDAAVSLIAIRVDARSDDETARSELTELGLTSVDAMGILLESNYAAEEHRSRIENSVGAHYESVSATDNAPTPDTASSVGHTALSRFRRLLGFGRD